MILINCSRQFALDNPDRRPLICYPDVAETLYPFTDQPDSETAEYFVPALFDSEKINEYIELTNQLNDLKSRVDKMKFDFTQDADAYNSVDGNTEPYSISFGNNVMYAKESTTINVLDGKEMQTWGLSNLVETSEVTYKIGPDWKKAVQYILTGRYGPRSTEDEIIAINEECWGSLTTLETIQKKLRKAFDANMKLFKNTYHIEDEKAEEFARRIELAANHDAIVTLAKALDCTFDEAVKHICRYTTASTSQSVGLTTTTA